VTFSEFKAYLGERYVFSSSDVPVDRRRLSDWAQRGLLERVRRDVYLTKGLAFYDRKVVAKELVPQSYVTGMWALQYHGLVTERYLGPLVSATHGRSFILPFDGTLYKYQKICRPAYRETCDCPSGFSVATPLTAFFDLYHRRPVDRLPEHFRYEYLDEDLLERATRAASRFLPYRHLLRKLWRKTEARKRLLAARRPNRERLLARYKILASKGVSDWL
jgi:hypothetical protein